MDVIITTNSPGEVSAWVKPMVKKIKEEWPDAQIAVFIPPCTFASGREVPVVQSFSEVRAAHGPGAYLRYALLRAKPRGFRPSREGFVLFLGGDLGHATLLGKRLRYPVYAYTERDAGHAEDIRLFFVSSEKVLPRMERKGVPPTQIRVVGNLMLDAVHPDVAQEEMTEILALKPGQPVLNLFPGSRPREVAISLPLYIKAALRFLEMHPDFKPVITLAPFITMENVRAFLQKASELTFQINEVRKSPGAKGAGGRSATTEGIASSSTSTEDKATKDEITKDATTKGVSTVYQLVVNGVEFALYRGNSYNTMQLTELAISLPGTNNVELAAMGVPTLVILPLNWPELIPLPGVVGMVGEIPLLGPFLKRRVVIPKLARKFPVVSPTNRAEDQLIFPELVGLLDEEKIAARASQLVNEELDLIRAKLADYKKEENVAGRIIAFVRADLLSYLQNRRESI